MSPPRLGPQPPAGAGGHAASSSSGNPASNRFEELLQEVLRDKYPFPRYFHIFASASDGTTCLVAKYRSRYIHGSSSTVGSSRIPTERDAILAAYAAMGRFTAANPDLVEW